MGLKIINFNNEKYIDFLEISSLENLNENQRIWESNLYMVFK